MLRILSPTLLAILGLTHAAMADGFAYTTPANIAQKDLAGDPDALKDMLSRWDETMNAFTQMGIVGNPWTNNNDAPRSNYQDPKKVPPSASDPVQPITWTAFPNKVEWYFNTSQNNPYQINRALIYPLVDEGWLNDNHVMQAWIDAHGDAASTLRWNLDAVLSNNPEFGQPSVDNFSAAKIPTDVCPVVNWGQDKQKWTLFSSSVAGPRGWKDEYNEWVVTRNAEGKITKIAFTAENPEYWFTLWLVDPTKVLDLYHELVGPQVQLEDLYLRDAQGNVVNDAQGNPSYNPLNKWNYGNVATATHGGAVHLTSPPNTVGAEMYLGAASTMMRNLTDAQYSPANMICWGQYGGNFRNSDPNIGMQGNQVTRNIQLPITLTNPIALYMQYPDFSNYVTPDGTPASEFFTIVRGRTAAEAGTTYDQILHATFEVPASYGYTVSDIMISPPSNEDKIFPGFVGGTPALPILYGSQMAETFNQALAATAYAGKSLEDTRRYPIVSARENPNGWAQPLVTAAEFYAVQNQPAISAATIPLLPLAAKPGQILQDMALEVLGGAKDATIDYVDAAGQPVPGIKVQVISADPLDDGTAPGKHGVYNLIAYRLTITIAKDVPPGSYGVRVTNPGNAPDVATPGNLIIR